MSEAWTVEVYCPCGEDSRYRVYVDEDLRRCRKCGRTFRLKLDRRAGVCDVEMDERVGGGGLLVDEGVRALSVQASSTAYRPGSILLEEASSSSPIIPFERAVSEMRPTRSVDGKPESPLVGAQAEDGFADAQAER